MQYEVKLMRNGSQFVDYVYANGQNEAKEIAIHRNPGSTFLGANAVCDGYDNHDNYHTTSSGTYEGSSNYDDESYVNEPTGCLGLIFGLFKAILILCVGFGALTLITPSEDSKEKDQRSQNSFSYSLTHSLDEYDARNRR